MFTQFIKKIGLYISKNIINIFRGAAAFCSQKAAGYIRFLRFSTWQILPGFLHNIIIKIKGNYV